MDWIVVAVWVRVEERWPVVVRPFLSLKRWPHFKTRKSLEKTKLWSRYPTGPETKNGCAGDTSSNLLDWTGTCSESEWVLCVCVCVWRKGPVSERVPARVTPSRGGWPVVVRPLLSSKRRPHFQTHINGLGRNKDSVMSPDVKPEITMLARTNSNLLLYYASCEPVAIQQGHCYWSKGICLVMSRYQATTSGDICVL
jgi:hypothetical protein